MADGDCKFLTLRRLADGRLIPHVDGVPLLGCVDVVIGMFNGQAMAQISFRTDHVFFDTAPHPMRQKLN